SMLKRVATARYGHPDERRLSDEIIRICELANKQRRRFAHVHVLEDDKGVQQIIFKELTEDTRDDGAPSRRISRKEIEALMKTMEEYDKKAEAALIELW